MSVFNVHPELVKHLFYISEERNMFPEAAKNPAELVHHAWFPFKDCPINFALLQKRLEVLTSEGGRLHDEVYTIYGHC